MTVGMDDALVDAAARAFAHHGFRGATLERIAAEAGVSRVTLHRRKVSKNGLLEALVARATHAYREALWPALTASGPAGPRLQLALEALCAVAEDHMPVLTALRSHTDAVFHEPSRDDALTRTVFTEPLERLLLDGHDDGTLNGDLDPLRTATVLFNLVGWTYLHLREGHRWSAPEARDAVVAIALRGVLR